MKKPWAGRFKERTAKLMEEFSQSISFDRRLWQEDIEGSRAHAKMLCKQGIINEKELKKILEGLDSIEKEIKEGKFQFREELEDVHMNIERALIYRVGSAGAKLHTARSRNDQVATDLRLYLRKKIDEMIKQTARLIEILINISEKNIEIIMPGYTHLQKAQPVLLSHHLLAHAWSFERDIKRMIEAQGRINQCPLGAGALAGSSIPIDRHFTAKELGFEGVIPNSMDAVSDRDFVCDVLYCCAMLMMHLSRLSEELVLWVTDEFNYAEMSDRFSTGSSMMPQKKNPDAAELIRGKTGRVYGNLISMLTTLKGLPLTYNRDLQEDKESVFDSVDTVIMSLRVVAEMFSEIRFNKEKLKQACESGYITATDLAEYLVKKGIPFRNAHEITGKTVLYCIEKRKKLNELTLEEFRKFSDKIQDDVYKVLTPEGSIDSKYSYGSTSRNSVKEQIKLLKKILKALKR